MKYFNIFHLMYLKISNNRVDLRIYHNQIITCNAIIEKIKFTT